MSAERPNLIYIFADQWRRQAVGYRNEDPVITPHMDEFARNNLVFDHAISCTPLCSPHRAALLTGRYPQSTGVYTNCKIGADVMLSPDETAIGDVLKEAGYDTGYIGKWHLDLPEMNLSEAPESGARDWDAYTPPGPKRHGFDFWYSYGADDHHLTPHYWRDDPRMIEVDQWSAEHETDVALEYMRNRNQDKPFALFLSWNPPHSPFELVPDKYKKWYEGRELPFYPNVRFERLQAHTGEPVAGGKENLERYMRDYYAAITGLDEQFGRILAGLRDMGLEDDTIVVLSADHGELLGAHGLMAKHAWYEESIGIPCLMRWPHRIPQGRTDILFNSVDIMPTLLGLMSLPIPAKVEGRDYSGDLLGRTRSEVSSAFISAFPGRKEAIEAFARCGLDNRRYGWRGVRTLRHTYVVHRGYAPNEPLRRYLYDNVEDPFQMNPVCLDSCADHPLARELEEELRGWLSKTNDLFAID
ncbi:Endo-4-O-sulfatase [Paenibacillus sp. CECT 9249]|uniref:sulfatase family protein n=1 Tax=Paenibacillus sp. CECT 9249 TaxID=2845385 RepID=UPI001E61D30F|nr:sulfatase [Paenibacillus sp. CECT 9249]CAH0118975.1 Endo-4-O-sulfatase [Paenibacillus sp. CECT 9249]